MSNPGQTGAPASAEAEARRAAEAQALRQALVRIEPRLFKRGWPTVKRVEDEIAETQHRINEAGFALDDLYDDIFRGTDDDDDAEEIVEKLGTSEKAKLDVAKADCAALSKELQVLHELLIQAKLRQQNAPPWSVRAASGGRCSPR
jgi:hypothetical protein